MAAPGSCSSHDYDAALKHWTGCTLFCLQAVGADSCADTPFMAQEQVDKTVIFDYADAVPLPEERWLGFVRARLLQHQYDSGTDLMLDVQGIVRCAEKYHGRRASRFKNPGTNVVTCKAWLQATSSHPAQDALTCCGQAYKGTVNIVLPDAM